MEGLGETKDMTSAEGLGKCAAKGTVARLWPDAPGPHCTSVNCAFPPLQGIGLQAWWEHHCQSEALWAQEQN